ncbi:MAG: GNAT family N-acetyltransferase, partial [Holophagales bacterium]|nr:GNAT family N-acetyltransferase [Holophagales bacterium]
MQLRRARQTDAAALAELAESTFREAFEAVNHPDDMNAFCAETFGEAIQAREIGDPTLEIWVCDRGGELIAFLQLRSGEPPPCVEAAEPLEIQRFYVDARWHGKGVAQLLMELALRRAGEGGFDTVWLGVWEHNPRAIAFYRKQGFEEVGDHIFR